MLATSNYAGSTLIPARFIKKTDKVKLSLGAYANDGTFIQSIAVTRSWGESGKLSYIEAVKSISKPMIYGGVLFDHFGHFLIDTLARVWAIRDNSEREISWICMPDFNGLKKWQVDIFNLLGIDEKKFTFIKEPTKFKNISLPEPAYICSGWADGPGVGALACYPFSAPKQGKRVWLSRSKLPLSDGGIDNEEELEALLTLESWDVINPELLSIPDLLKLLSDAEVIAGFAGSAFHLLLLAKNIQAKVILIQREDTINSNYLIIQKVAKLHQQILPCDRILKSKRGGAKARFQLKDPQKVVSAIKSAALIQMDSSQWEIDATFDMKSPDFFRRKFSPVWLNELDRNGVRLSHYKEIPRVDVHSLFSSPPLRVLDVGCATGAAGGAIKRLFNNPYVCGIELNKDSIALAKERLDKVFEKPISELSPKDLLEIGKFDTVMYLDVLEHMYNPWSELAFLRRHISPDAQLIISLPNAANIDTLKDLIGGRWRYRGAGVMDITHMRFFGEQDMVNMFYQTGFRVDAKKYLKTGKSLPKPTSFPHIQEIDGSRIEIRDEAHFDQIASPQIAFRLVPAIDKELTEEELGLKYSIG